MSSLTFFMMLCCILMYVYSACDVAEGAQTPGHAPHPGSHRNALLTYVHTWRSFASLHPGVDFMLSTFESWRRSSGHYPNKKIDLVAVASEPVAEKLQQHVTVGHICQVQKLSIMSSVESWHAVGDHTIRDHPYSQCWILTHNSTHGQEWQGFPLVHDILHLGSDDFRHFMEEMRYGHMVVVPNGAIVTPLLPTFTASMLTVSQASYSWHPDTRHKLRHVAKQFNVSHSGSHGIGDVWAGPAPVITELARAAIPILQRLLEITFEDTTDPDWSLGDWLDEIDWEDIVNPSTSAGLQSWNVGHAVKYATEIAVHHLPGKWTWDNRLGPSIGALKTGSMHDAAVIPPTLANGGYDLHQLLRNTHAYCSAWAAGNKGKPGSLLHFAGLIACQGSETEAPIGEQRYAVSVQAPTSKHQPL